ATERPTAVIGIRAVVPHEDATVAPITIKRTAELSDRSRRLYPARSFRIELSQFLKFEIFFFRQKLNAHGRRHADRAILWLMFLSRIQRLIVVTKTYATTRSLRRTIEKDVLAGLLIPTYHIRLTAGCFHHVERPQLCGVSLQFRLYFRPLKTLLPVHVLLETLFQRFE